MASEPPDPDQDPLERPLEEVSFHGRPVMGLAIMAASLVGLFWVGIGFDVFESRLIFDSPGPYLFLGAIWLGVFGLARSFFEAFSAFRITVVVAGVYLLIFLAGRIVRGEI